MSFKDFVNEFRSNNNNQIPYDTPNNSSSLSELIQELDFERTVKSYQEFNKELEKKVGELVTVISGTADTILFFLDRLRDLFPYLEIRKHYTYLSIFVKKSGIHLGQENKGNFLYFPDLIIGVGSDDDASYSRVEKTKRNEQEAPKIKTTPLFYINKQTFKSFDREPFNQSNFGYPDFGEYYVLMFGSDTDRFFASRLALDLYKDFNEVSVGGVEEVKDNSEEIKESGTDIESPITELEPNEIPDTDRVMIVVYE